MAWLMHYSDALKINYLIFPRSTQAPSKPGSLTLFSNKHSKTKTHSCLRLSSCYHYYKTLFINVWISDAKLSLFPMLGLMAIAKLSSSWPVPVKFNFNWDLHYYHCIHDKLLLLLTHPPTWASIFEPLLDYLGSWNLVWKLYSTKLGQLANQLAPS